MHVLNSAHILAAILGGLVVILAGLTASAIRLAWITRRDKRTHIHPCTTEWEKSSYDHHEA